jgi:putative peptidoglycan lipid II flippase
MFCCFIVQVSFYGPALPRKYLSFEFKKIKVFSIAIIPFIIFISIEELNLLVDQYFATSLKEGSVSNLLYASRLVKIFGAIFVVSIITVFYPKISSLLARGKYKNVRYISCLIIEFLTIFTIPIVAVFFFFSMDIVSILYGKTVDAEVAGVLSFYSFLVFTSSIYMIQIRLVYSIGINKYVLILCVISSILNYILNTILIKFLGLSGLALSTVLVSSIQVALFDFYLRTMGIVLFSAKMLLRILLHIIYFLGVALAIGYFLPILVNELWILGGGLILLVYFITSIILNRRLYMRLINL